MFSASLLVINVEFSDLELTINNINSVVHGTAIIFLKTISCNVSSWTVRLVTFWVDELFGQC